MARCTATLWALLVLSMSLPVRPLQGQEIIALRDGTSITGKLVRVSGDTLFLSTSFSDELPVLRSLVVSIEFEPGIDFQTEVSPPAGKSAESAKLTLIVTGPKLTTSIRYRKSGDREDACEANRIVFRITANDKVVYEETDDRMDDEIRSEGWTILKNHFEFGRYEASLPAGKYQITLFIGNDMANAYRGQLSSGAISISRTKEEVELFQGGTTTLVMKSSQPILGLGGFSLKWVD